MKDVSYRLEIADKNFINELKNEFKIPEEYLENMEEKIKEYVKKFSNRWSEIVYIGYDLEKDKYYQDYYSFGEYSRHEITKKEAESIGVGSFCNLLYDAESTDNELETYAKFDYKK